MGRYRPSRLLLGELTLSGLRSVYSNGTDAMPFRLAVAANFGAPESHEARGG